MINALKAKAAVDAVIGTGRTEEELRAWCWGWNERCREARWPYWLYVSRDKETGSLSCKSRSGSDALDVINVLNGWKPDFMNWSGDNLDSEFRILRHMARMGMPEDCWESRFSRRVGVN